MGVDSDDYMDNNNEEEIEDDVYFRIVFGRSIGFYRIINEFTMTRLNSDR